MVVVVFVEICLMYFCYLFVQENFIKLDAKDFMLVV